MRGETTGSFHPVPASRAAWSLQQQARRFPCRLSYGGCGARPGEFCRTWQDRRSYAAHRDRLKQENEDWQQKCARHAGEAP